MDFTCRGCSLSFKDQFAFFMHFFTNLCVAKQSRGTDFCPNLENENRTVLDLKHLRSEGSNVCEICGKYCWAFGGLAKHIFTHVGAMPFFCPFCQFSSLSKFHLQKHIYRHGSQARNGNQKFNPKLNKAHVCDFCNSAFTDWKDLALHYVKHLKATPFKCIQCCVMFLEERDFIIHRHLHNYSSFCELCRMPFNNRIDRLEHVLAHNQSKMFRKFTLAVPYERLMRLRANWYNDLFSGSSICDKFSLDNTNESHNFFTEENNTARFENPKGSKLVYLNYPSTQTVSQQPPELYNFSSADSFQNINFDVEENVTALSKDTLDIQEGDELILGFSEKPLEFDSLDYEKLPKRTINPLEYSNNLKPSSENELDANITVASDIFDIETKSKSSAHPIKFSNTNLKLKEPFADSPKLAGYVQNSKSCRNFSKLQCRKRKSSVRKLQHEKNFESSILRKRLLVSEDRSIDENLHKDKSDTDYNFYTMQFVTNHSKPLYDYSKPNDRKNEEVEIRGNVSHLCEVIFEEGEEDVSLNYSLFKEFTKYDSASDKILKRSVNSSISPGNYQTSSCGEWNFTYTFVDGQYKLIKIPQKFKKQQINCCKDNDKENKTVPLIDLVRNLKEVFIALDKLPSYVQDMPSFRKYIKSKKDKDGHFSSAYKKGSKLSGLSSKRRIPLKVKKTNLKSNTVENSSSDDSSVDDGSFSDCSSSADEMLHHVHAKLQTQRVCSTHKGNKTKKTASKLFAKSVPQKLVKDDSSSDYSTFSDNSSSPGKILHHPHGSSQRPMVDGTRKNAKQIFKTKKIASKLPAKCVPQKTVDYSSATETCPEFFSDSSSDISDFMHRWLFNSKRKVANNSPHKNASSSVRTKKSIPKPRRKPPCKPTRKPQSSLNSVQTRKPFVHLWKLPKSIYEKHLKGKPIMLSSLSPLIEKIEEFREKQPSTSQVLQDHTYCLPSVSSSILLEHNYC
ncbi:unnamed protein product [Larinioides sclopetarius]|uniref:C2H2-type domain-containing protein n=1 Tax=Larinioides sclopetarius TaxID=280406 RepID=A0AAV2BT20_9ARAC